MTAELLRQFERLEECRAELLSRIEGLDEPRLNRRPGENQWSVIQVICHLTRAEELTLVYIRKKMKYRSNLQKAGIAAALRSVALTVALRSGLRFKAPARSAEIPEEQDLATTRGEWDRVREEWKATLESFPAELAGQAVFRHPVAGRLSLAQGLRFMEEHILHHAKQIDRILARVA